MGRFLLSFDEFNLDRGHHRQWQSLFREPDFRLSGNFLERIKGMVEKLPPIEQDVIELYYFTKPSKKQEDIALLLGVSQQTVSHRLRCAFRRMKFLLAQPEVEARRMRIDLESLFTNKFTVDVFCSFAVTSSQTVTASRLNCSQQRVCWHLNTGMNSLRQENSIDSAFYSHYFQTLMSNRNILREVLAGRKKTNG